jgi:hypothetical protein
MPIEKRPRGRPRGSGKDDSRPLAQVADLLVREPLLKPTTAIKRIVRKCNDRNVASEAALVRRLQAKWKENGNSLLTAARERPPTVLFLWMEIIRNLRDLCQQFRNLQDSPLIKAFRELQAAIQRNGIFAG